MDDATALVGESLLQEVWHSPWEDVQRTWELFTATLKIVREVDAREAKFELRVETLVAGNNVACTIDLPITCKEHQLQVVLAGFVCMIQGKRLLQRQRQQKTQHEFVHEFTTVVDGVSMDVAQPRVLRQWHPNACGYHSLFNALVLFGKIDPEDEEILFWANSFAWLRMLTEHNRIHKTWSATSLQSLTLDQVQIEYVLSHDRGFRGEPVLSFGTMQEFQQAFIDRFPKDATYIIGCVTHWAIIAIKGGKRILFAESFNKPILQFLDCYMGNHSNKSLSEEDKFHSIEDMARHIVRLYCPKFVEKLKMMSNFYKHLPQELLEQYFENGVEEYWKGNLKNNLYWTHRPFQVRVMLMVKEIGAMVKFLDHILSLPVSPVTPPLPNHSPQKACRGTRDLETFCVEHSKKYSMSTHHINNEPYVLDVSNDAAYRGYIRREEDWPPDSIEYKSGNSVENRKCPPLPEVPGDVFDRQRVMVDFDQGLVERQICLVVGTGGVGQNVALVLARLGVQHICLVDYDSVDPSNLTRQCLSSINDIGLQKVDAARINLQKQHSLGSNIVTFDGNILTNWSTIVSFARNATAIFNCADIGVMFDYCIASLAKEMQIPLMSGQSFAWKFMSEVYSGEPQHSCAFCQETTPSSFGLLNLDIITQRFLQYKQEQPGLEGHELIVGFMQQDRQYRVIGDTTSTIIADSWRDVGGTINWEDLKSWFHRFLCRYHDYALDLLQPGRISSLPDLCFVPRPIYPPTRFYGSWVCPCLSVSNFMVSQWMNLLTSPATGDRDPPVNIVFNLDEGMTTEEQMSYELGLGLNRADRSFVKSTPSLPSCKICKAAQLLHMRERGVLFSAAKVYLRPTKHGMVFGVPMVCSDDHATSAATSWVPPQSKGLIFPVMPCVSPAMYLSPNPRPIIGMAPPDLNTFPLVKCTKEEAYVEPSSLVGVASGIRSAIVFIHGKAYRLKGCGNGDQGFITKACGDHGEIMLRGCMFANTCWQELCMTTLVDEALKSQTNGLMFCANRPVCLYQYHSQRVQDVYVTPYCAVFETIGDRRLGDHLLFGMERLIPYLFHKEEEEEDVWTELRTEIATRRGNDEEELWDTATIAECGMNVCDGLETFPIRESADRLVKMSLDEFKSIVEVDSEKDISLLYELWISIATEFQTLLSMYNEMKKSVMLQLAKRLGYECGLVSKALQVAEISWGTYPDASGIHCNAHANNLVVLDPWKKGENGSHNTVLLAPLDFDMAFQRKTFRGNIIESSHQKVFPTTWEKLVEWEQKMGMRTSLAGSNFTSTGVSNRDPTETWSEELKLMKVAIRDTLVNGYDQALALSSNLADSLLQKQEQELDAFAEEGTRAIIKLALILSYGIIC